jgi:ATP-dependent Clp protease ATP-binding subunit ClpC
LFGAGSFSLDLSGALAPYLKNGTLPIIASMTEGNYKAFFQKSSLSQLFTPITLTEPMPEQSERMVMEKTKEIEMKQSVIITYSALKFSVKYANRYSQSMVLPGSALAFLSDAISGLTHQSVAYYGNTKKRLLTKGELIRNFEHKTKITLSEPSATEKDMLLHLEVILHGDVVGQDEAINTISQAMRRIRSGVDTLNRPVSFLFLGPTGVGKTEAAKSLATTCFGGERAMIRLDMSEYADEQGQRRLLGALPGQGDELGELTEKVRDNPLSLILLDEFEKAHPSILNLFLQILDDGRLTDNKGRVVSFMNTIIIATSNAGSDLIHAAVESGKAIDKAFSAQLIEHLQTSNIFRSELLNRFDAIVTFKSLTITDVTKITSILLRDLRKSMEEKDIALSFDQGVLEKISKEAYDKEFGARPIRRYVQNTLEELISQKLLKNELNRGDRIKVIVGKNGEFDLLKI